MKCFLVWVFIAYTLAFAPMKAPRKTPRLRAAMSGKGSKKQTLEKGWIKEHTKQNNWNVLHGKQLFPDDTYKDKQNTNTAKDKEKKEPKRKRWQFRVPRW
jgi:hypothetical protein